MDQDRSCPIAVQEHSTTIWQEGVSLLGWPSPKYMLHHPQNWSIMLMVIYIYARIMLKLCPLKHTIMLKSCSEIMHIEFVYKKQARSCMCSWRSAQAWCKDMTNDSCTVKWQKIEDRPVEDSPAEEQRCFEKGKCTLSEEDEGWKEEGSEMNYSVTMISSTA